MAERPSNQPSRNSGRELTGASLLAASDGPTYKVSVDGTKVESRPALRNARTTAVIEASSRDLLALLLGRPLVTPPVITGDVTFGQSFAHAFLVLSKVPFARGTAGELKRYPATGNYVLRSYVARSTMLRCEHAPMGGPSGTPSWRRSNDPPILILTSLAGGAKHGHALLKDIEEFAGVKLGPGALYGAITRLEERGLIEPLESDDRRRPYQITAAGSEALADSSLRCENWCGWDEPGSTCPDTSPEAGVMRPGDRERRSSGATKNPGTLASAGIRLRGAPVMGTNSSPCSTTSTKNISHPWFSWAS